MAAPNFAGASTGATDAGGAWSYTVTSAGWTLSSPAPGEVIVLQILQDGTTNSAVALTGASGIENLAGTDNAWTIIPGPNGDSSWPIGVAEAARQFIYIGRKLTGDTVASGTNSTSEDLYYRMYLFNTVSTGTTLATVIENGTAGTAFYEAGTSATAADRGVTTLGADRLVLNLLAINDDNPFAGFGGGPGFWELQASYAEPSGTDGALYLNTHAAPSAATFDGATGSITDSDAWGVVGFALIGTTPDAPATLILSQPGIDFGATAVLMGGIRRAWHRRRSGIFVPEVEGVFA